MITSCPHCHRRLTVADDLAGRQGECPACHRPFVIRPPHAASSEPAVVVGPAPQATSPINLSTPGRGSDAPAAWEEALSELRQQAVSTPNHREHCANSTSSSPKSNEPTDMPKTTSGTGFEAPSAPRSRPPPLPPIRPVSDKGRTPPPPFGLGEQGAAANAPHKTGFAWIVSSVSDNLSCSLDLSKIGFQLLGSILTGLVLIPALLGLLMVVIRISPNIALFYLLVAGGVLLGVFGVMAGGLAFLTNRTPVAPMDGIAQALRFCQRRFLSLFGATLLVCAAFAIGLLVLNGLVYVLNMIPAIGPFLGVGLYLPQLFANALLVIGLLTVPLVPCAIAVEDIDTVESIRRVIRQLVTRTGDLVVHLLLNLGGGVFLALVLSVLTLGLPTVLTYLTNGPGIDSLMSDFGALETPGPSLGDANQVGSLIKFWFTLLAIFALPEIYSIVAFTRHYQRIIASESSPAGPGPTLPKHT